ncbi:MAG: hypothetical protein MUE74_13925, partial [Bacteroidales bacterium]|nr:hypothetical protein [Bacteroidales bacterium]
MENTLKVFLHPFPVVESPRAGAFWYFADENAVILRGNDSLIKGRESIRNCYEKNLRPGVTLTWTPDFIGVSDCDNPGYNY